MSSAPGLAASGSSSATTLSPGPQLGADIDDGVLLARKRKKKKKKKSKKNGSKPAKAAPEPAPAPPAEPAEAQSPPTPAPSTAGPSGAAPVPAAPEGLAGRRSGPSRIEFDDRLIQGQTNKANAIYLFERRASELRTLVKKRRHYHREIDETLE